MTSSVSRRRALAGAATLGVGVPLLAACGDDSTAATDPVSPDPTSAAPTPEPTAATGAPSTGAGSGSAAGLVAAADVPVGGGVVLKADELVVTQPVAGEFKAFTALCTHQGCLVGSVTDGSIHCPCHDSLFSATDGSVESGPASAPLAAVAVTVVEGQVARA
ncbi:Rieske (2Fe-2S) protein [Nocardioides kongjuensis]|uniref:Cytochrome bc1 complex Rieske iron-sulfur subunit n=1 Tax=Nocardioides kongjuensis TaxID=349522 RepID=A0A852RHA8_9ACTN|nr:Rieske (2Fe-2S) protein [Nocardioides kongjuensis]NYD29939.1 Rieske Fe-S protein [Nocardioides kongjuensis]